MNSQQGPAILDAARRPLPAASKRLLRREPGRWDYLAYLLVLPLVIASWLTALGIRPQAELGTWQAYIYVASRMLLAWWAAHCGALAAGRWLGQWLESLWKVQMAGFLMVWAPVTLLFHLHVHLFVMLSPDAARHLALPDFALSLEYLARLVARSAVFFLPLWMAVAHAYRKQFGVDWYGPRHTLVMEPPAAAAVASPTPQTVAPSFLAQSRLPANAVIHTLGAAEHYIEVVCDSGKDLVRHRFTDAVREITSLGLGCQVHRSWWVAWDAVADVVPDGRGLDVILRDGRRIPVSLTYKNSFLSRYPVLPKNSAADQAVRRS